MHLGLQLMNAYKDFYLQHNVYKWVVSCILIITLTWLPESAMGTDKAMIQAFAFYFCMSSKQKQNSSIMGSIEKRKQCQKVKELRASHTKLSILHDN